MKRCQEFSREELQNFCNNSESYRDLARHLGYSPDGGSTIAMIKEIIKEYQLNVSHFNGKGHTKNKGRIRTSTEQYLNNKVRITSYNLRNRLLRDGIFEYRCCSCGLSEWLGNPIPLELHHKDGNKHNNSLDNLELRCPNCHYFTETYKSKNRHVS